uniref:Small EDRK-rich factor-like N-terminal domain-containing protein n=1 Tax=Knipowitschia caucasica TaxID=637954 RepID=A0AAV2KKJ3_KNICA
MDGLGNVRIKTGVGTMQQQQREWAFVPKNQQTSTTQQRRKRNMMENAAKSKRLSDESDGRRLQEHGATLRSKINM